MPDVPISAIQEEFEHVGLSFNIESAIARRGSGLNHPGHDCWTLIPAQLGAAAGAVGFSMVGVSMIATDLMQVLHAISGCRMSLLSPHLTFHFVQGDSVVRHPRNQRARNDKVFTGLYAAWNCAQFACNRRDVLHQHPEYNQWFSQQAVWNLYSYQCATTIEALPYEYKLLWQNETIDHPFLSNCNLPSVCGKCRGRDGTKRPVADLMSEEPCGFCRCGSDVHKIELITLPPLAERPKPGGRPASTTAFGPDPACREPEPPTEPELLA